MRDKGLQAPWLLHAHGNQDFPSQRSKIERMQNAPELETHLFGPKSRVLNNVDEDIQVCWTLSHATKAVDTQELEAGTDCDRPSNQKVTASKEFPAPKEGRTGESGENLAPGKMGAPPYLCVESPRVISTTILSQLDGKLLNHWIFGLGWLKRQQATCQIL
ncbi:hypothetical protein B0H13DRAFT_1910412 [Mycena leptocephala]|nr:hypothetical protein B0H13DRAFT_1910412 [Mycena leptocephala]